MRVVNYKYILLLLAILCVNISCNDFLDETPDNRTELDTDDKITRMLVSAYPQKHFAVLAEIGSDNVDDNGSKWSGSAYTTRFLEQVYSWKDISESDMDDVTNLWAQSYKAIGSSNMVLEAIEKMGNPERLNPQKGEALITRAYNHFVLVNVFCMHYGKDSSTDLGIPYMTKPETEVNPQYQRGNVAEVYRKIDADIQEALPLIDDKIYSVPKYHFNKSAALAFAARFYLYYGDYKKVIQYATEVLGANPKLVLRNWEALASSNEEDIIGNNYINADVKANLLLLSTSSRMPIYYQPYYMGSRYSMNMRNALTEGHAASGPWSGSTYLPTYSTSGLPKVYTNKFRAYFEVTDPVNQTGVYRCVFPIFTTDETLLCRAEAYILQKNYDKAAADLHIFTSNYTKGKSLTRDNIKSHYASLSYYTWNYPTVKKHLNPDFIIEEGEQECFIHCLLQCRRMLTMHNGMRWFDVKRYGIEIYRREINSDSNEIIRTTDQLKKRDKRWAKQLPKDVISAGMEPNPRD